MTSESPAIQVRPLTSVLDGKNPVEFIHSLVDVGYDRFYVKVPQGFWVSLFDDDPFPPDYQVIRPLQPASDPAPDDNQPQSRYLQLDISHLRELLQNPPIALHRLGGGSLESGVTRNGLVSIDFKYRQGVPSFLLPTSAAIADKVPTRFDMRSGGPVVVKTLNRTRRQYSYVLHGIRLEDVFVEEPTLSNALENMRAPKVAHTPVSEDLPEDPYRLRESSPLVFEILHRAFLNRGKTRNEIDVPLLEAEFHRLSADYKKNPKPFNNGRHEFAAQLANPFYKYSSKRSREIEPPREPVKVPLNPFFDQKFINAKFKKLLYAACCWSGAMEPRLGGDREKLVDLLVNLGFYDADESDQVQTLVFFITGEMYQRNKHKSEFRHIRGDRK